MRDKRDCWKQSNPQDQLTVVLMAAQGIIHNMMDGMYKDPTYRRQKMLELEDLVVQGQELTKFVEGTW